jgi:NAD-dependent dihydropyrimidine dehydrogenase PreA subunit
MFMNSYSQRVSLGGIMAYVIAEPCVGVKDTACVDACPVDCIHPRRDEAGFSSAAHLHIEGENCICCGACVPVCPVSAIFLAEELPEKWKDYELVNKEWFAPRTASVDPK